MMKNKIEKNEFEELLTIFNSNLSLYGQDIDTIWHEINHMRSELKLVPTFSMKELFKLYTHSIEIKIAFNHKIPTIRANQCSWKTGRTGDFREPYILYILLR